jgi:type VI secretion system protein ImpK
MTVPTTAGTAGSLGTSARRGQLALSLQEILTATVRLRANRQGPADAESFRAHVRNLVSGAEQEARVAGYASADVRLALYAVVIFLDEAVLNSNLPAFRDWPRRPLQDELFAGNVGGEAFFQYLRQLTTRDDSDDLADLLEVFQLCLLLGFQGRYSVAQPEELQVWTARVGEQIRRIRGDGGPLSPAWAPPADEGVQTLRDPWIRRLLVSGAAIGVVAIVLFMMYFLVLRSGADTIATLAPVS